MTRRLDSGERHFLRLIDRDSAFHGRAPVSDTVYPLVERMPHELVEHGRDDAGKAWARLTPEGEAVLRAMEWLGTP